MVNGVNPGRRSDYEALKRYHEIHDANRALVSLARDQEAINMDRAIAMYQEALTNLARYAPIQAERGLVGQLIEEERQELGLAGQIFILDRLTLCLVKAHRIGEAQIAIEAYFQAYRRDLDHPTTRRIRARMEKALKSCG